MVMLSLLFACVATAVHPLARQKASVMPEGVNQVAAMAADANFVFSVTSEGHVIKASKTDVNRRGIVDLNKRHGISKLTTIGVDASFVYVTGASAGKHYLYQLNIADMTTHETRELTADNGIAYAMALSDDHVYIGFYSMPGTVRKYTKTGLLLVGTATAPAGYNDIRSLDYDFKFDPDHIYGNTNTSPGKVVKIAIADMTIVAAKSMDVGEDHILAGTTQDSSHVYVGTLTAPGYVIKLDRNTLAKVGRCEAGVRITAMVSDHQYVYAADYESPAKIVKVKKADMTVVETTNLLATENQISAMVAASPNLYIGTDTSPAHVIQFTGMLVDGDCVMNPWANWGVCDKTCGNGNQIRTRTVRVPAVHGGTPCPTELSQSRACNDHIVCPTTCTGGKVWTTTGSLPAATCSTPTPTLTSTNLQQCQCPVAAPYWHEAAEACVSADHCSKTVLCPNLTCDFVNGRIKTTRTSAAPIKDFHCAHATGRLQSCKCMCKPVE
jgi:hypothetical protein